MSDTKRLYPPYIEGKITAQTGNEIAIPFEMNRAVSAADYESIAVRIKTVSTDHLVGEFESCKVVGNTAYFSAGQNLQIGQFYKIQLAYKSNNDKIGYYSTVGVFKYTSLPEINIEGLSINQINSNLRVYQGVFSTQDATEKEYSYSFNLYNDTELVYSSGELIHNSNNDVDKFILPINLNLGIRYTLTYTTTTINGLSISKSYYVMDSILTEIPMALQGTLTAELDYDNGYISIDLVSNNQNSALLGGQYRLLRFANDKYEIVDSFIIQSAISNDANRPTHIYKDFTIQQGVEYRYALQQYNDNVLSEKLYSNRILADFEDMFLYDGERQLKMRFNPKVTSFKTTLLESKLDTLGGQYPFFFRNGNTSYKDFPISALISMLSDDNEFFFKWKEDDERARWERINSGAAFNNTDSYSFKSTDLVSINLRREREFKLEVLNWLNNGQPKLFRSPTEGNYIVRLMNVSLSPNETLGRMLHTFQAQAYEVMENTFANLLDSELISSIKDIKSIVINQVELTKDKPKLADENFETLHLMLLGRPGTEVLLSFKNSSSTLITLGHTMIYDVPVQNDNPIVAVELEQGESVNVQYDTSSQLSYPLLFKNEKITKIDLQEKAAQFIGAKNNIITDMAPKQDVDNFNIMSLTLSAKPQADVTGIYTDVTLQSTLDGTLYTRQGSKVNNTTDFDVCITYEFDGNGNADYSKGVIINLAQHTLYEDLTKVYPHRWKLDSFGNITLTCDAFDDNRFKPAGIKIGKGVYANVYYSIAKYS